MRKIFVVALVIFSLLSVVTAQDDISTYQSEDGAVTFEYPDYWTIEQQDFSFGELYRYALWTPAENPFVPVARSRILFDITTRNQPAYEDLEDPLDLLAELALLEGDSPTIQDSEDLTLLDSPASRIEFETNDGTIVALYAIVFDADWVVFVSLATPADASDDFEGFEDDLLFIVESLVFDADLASTEFVREFEEYELDEDVELDETYESDDESLTFDYPSDWEIVEESSSTNISSDILYYADFEVDDIEINLTIIDVTSSILNYPPGRNTSEGYLASLRTRSDAMHVEDLLIDDIEVVNIINEEEVYQTIVYALDDSWIFSLSILADTIEEIESVRSEAFAVALSVDFALVASTVELPILGATVPQFWDNTLMDFQNGENYEFTFQSTRDNPIDGAMGIQIASFEDSYYNNDNFLELFEVYDVDEDDIEEIEVGNYTTYQATRDEYIMRVIIFPLNEDWLFIIVGEVADEDDLDAIQEVMEGIIEDMNPDLPE